MTQTSNVSRRRRIAIILATIYGVVIIAAVIYAIAKQSKPESDQTAMTTEKPTVRLSNFNEYKDYLIPFETLNIEESIYAVLADNTAKTDSSYTGSIRKGSFSATTTASGIPKQDFIVDIPSVQQSYHLSLEGDSTTEYRTVYVLCPQPQELMYSAFPCKDQASQ